ncbi:NAD(P)H-dependent oxidoreductase [Helicobacter cappadocius]|uniref:NAD(P)H-dependent oxidoreductase n=1 Tax=Helicobacter cappadocius TaxID=3063998 RepID=A0AA90SRY9_9HELI|nr:MULTISPECIES: NAD(P)H-dependent oxidoreductase [unclassified Helicobacter]MDO7252472.1 NAD(P)H-dependent oxidoreductase [Helicobacter sp. faydin-H75]MDP2538339.1 NAD(P)H-dependent oxidoreductase [Helicobacter sp. faydin-H76]
MQKDEVLEILNRRYSCRDFDRNRKIPNEDFEVILHSGRCAPSSLGLESWKFVVITNDLLKHQIAADAPGNQDKIEDCSHLVVVCAVIGDVIKPDSNYLKKLYKDEKYFQSINSMLKSVRENRLRNDEKMIESYAREQCFIAIGQMTQTAAMLDIDSCIIGGFYAAGLKGLLGQYMNTDDINPACLLSFGYSKKNTIPPKNRKPYEEAIKWIS